MLKGIESKRVLVTGAAQGIGLAVAKRFAEEGASVFVVDRVDDLPAHCASTLIASGVVRQIANLPLGTKLRRQVRTPAEVARSRRIHRRGIGDELFM